MPKVDRKGTPLSHSCKRHDLAFKTRMCSAAPVRLSAITEIETGFPTVITTGPTCKTGKLHHTEDWGYCGLPLAVYAKDLQECCEAVQKFNNDPVNKAKGRRAIGFTYQLVYSSCFFRDMCVGCLHGLATANRCLHRAACLSSNFTRGWTSITAVSAFLQPSSYYGVALG